MNASEVKEELDLLSVEQTASDDLIAASRRLVRAIRICKDAGHNFPSVIALELARWDGADQAYSAAVAAWEGVR